MKSFDKFQYDQTDLQELKIGETMSSVGNTIRRKVTGTANKVRTALQRRSNTITQKGAMGAKMRRSPELRRKAIEQQRVDAQKSINKNPNLRVDQPIKTNNRTGQSSNIDANKTTAITKYNPTDKNVKKFKPKSGIQQVMDRTKKNIKKKAESQSGRATGRALAGAAKAIFNYNPDKERTDTGQGGMGTAKRQRSGFLKSAIKGGVDAPSERINPKQRKTLGGKLLAIGKEKLQDKIGIEPTARTGQGRKLTGGTSRATDRERTQNIAKNVAKSGYKDEEQAKADIKNAPVTSSTQITGMSDADLAKTKKTDDEGQFRRNANKVTTTGGKTVPQDNPDLLRRRQMGADGMDSNAPSSDSVPSNTNSNTSSTTKQANQTRVKRRNVKSSEFQTDGNFDQKKYDAAKGRTTTKSGGGRPRTRTEGTMNLSKILEANRIAAEKEIKNQYGSVTNAQMRTPSQMRKDDARKKLLQNRNNNVMQNNQNNESYSHWREEFIWETDKKYPEKVKEIKPMSGKNTITINPEDETSKYKRGY